jgi:hypothetical protein
MTNFMMAQELQNTFCLVLNHFLFSRREALHVWPNVSLDFYPKLTGSMKFIHNFGRHLHDFGRNTPPVKAGTSHVISLNDGDFSSTLGRSYGGDVASRPRPNDAYFCGHK